MIGSSASRTETHAAAVAAAVVAFRQRRFRAADCLAELVAVVEALEIVPADSCCSCVELVGSVVVAAVGSTVAAEAAAAAAGEVLLRCWLTVAECFGQSTYRCDPYAWPVQCTLCSMASLHCYCCWSFVAQTTTVRQNRLPLQRRRRTTVEDWRWTMLVEPPQQMRPLRHRSPSQSDPYKSDCSQFRSRSARLPIPDA